MCWLFARQRLWLAAKSGAYSGKEMASRIFDMRQSAHTHSKMFFMMYKRGFIAVDETDSVCIEEWCNHGIQ